MLMRLMGTCYKSSLEKIQNIYRKKIVYSISFQYSTQKNLLIHANMHSENIFCDPTALARRETSDVIHLVNTEG